MDNKVEIVVGAQDNSRLDLDSLKKRLEDIGKKVETARVDLKGDRETEVSLERIALKLATVGRKVASPRIGLEGAARAEVEIAALDIGLDRLGEKSVKSRGSLRNLDNALSGVGASLGSLLGNLPLVGSGLEALGTGGTAGSIALAALAAIAGGLVLTLGPLIAGLSLITAGFGAFAAGAVPEVMKVWEAVKKGGKAFDDLSPAEKRVGDQMRGLKGEFGQFSKSLQPEVIRAFGDALGIVKKVLPALEPAAKAAGKALDGLLNMMLHWIDGPSGKKFLHWMQTEGPKAIATFGGFLQGLIKTVGNVLYWWDRLGNDLIKFAKDNAPAVEHAGGNVAHAFGNVEHAIGNVVHAVGNVIHAFGNILHAADNVGHAAGNVIHAMGNIAHAVGNVIGAVESLIGALGRIDSAANSALGGIPGKLFGFLGLASGGIVGAATGGIRSGMVMVGEHGRELAQLPAGSRVYNNAQTERMLAGGSPATVVLEIRGSQSEFDKIMLKWIKNAVRVQGGGDVQVAFGWQQ